MDAADRAILRMHRENMMRLVDAARSGDIGEVVYMVDFGNPPVCVNSVGIRGETALIAAAREGHTPVVKYLLEQGGADPNIRDAEGWTALMEAAANGHLTIVDLLLMHGADRTIVNRNGDTAFRLASRQRHHAVMHSLMARNFSAD